MYVILSNGCWPFVTFFPFCSFVNSCRVIHCDLRFMIGMPIIINIDRYWNICRLIALSLSPITFTVIINFPKAFYAIKSIYTHKPKSCTEHNFIFIHFLYVHCLSLRRIYVLIGICSRFFALADGNIFTLADKMYFYCLFSLVNVTNILDQYSRSSLK